MGIERNRFGSEPWFAGDKLLTDSVVLTDTYVNSVISDVTDKIPGSSSASKAKLGSLILTRREDILFWILMLLLFLAF